MDQMKKEMKKMFEDQAKVYKASFKNVEIGMK
jgi:hypothetical protein